MQSSKLAILPLLQPVQNDEDQSRETEGGPNGRAHERGKRIRTGAVAVTERVPARKRIGCRRRYCFCCRGGGVAGGEHCDAAIEAEAGDLVFTEDEVGVVYGEGSSAAVAHCVGTGPGIVERIAGDEIVVVVICVASFCG